MSELRKEFKNKLPFWDGYHFEKSKVSEQVYAYIEWLEKRAEALGLAHVVEPKGKLFCKCELPSMDMRGVCFKCDLEVDIKLAK